MKRLMFRMTSKMVVAVLLGMVFMLSSCYHRHGQRQQPAAFVEYSDRQLDSISFSTTHHYTNKFNFLVFKDSVNLIQQQPEEVLSGLEIDSFSVQKNHLLVVTDIRMVPQDSIDSVWVQLARIIPLVGAASRTCCLGWCPMTPSLSLS